jgi:hypothetical protein
VVIAFRAAAPTDRILFPVYEWFTEESVATGAPTLFYREGIVREIEVPWMHEPEASIVLPRPRGYLVLPGWPEIEDRLGLHDLRFEHLEGPVELEVETLRISNPRQDPGSAPSYQGRTRIEVDVDRATERRDLPAGTLWIPADQPDFEVAVQLLEPDAPDSLVSWGLLSIVLERKEYIGSRVLEEQVSGMLQDPEIAAEWATALQDETLASDPAARWLWWYRRTPYWDERVGLMPVMRVMTGRAVRQLPLAGRR